ncbi:hypothetical protein [Stieleria mannarensis]|uniref:hypothetical protein n=1 Tax=Stieleria mannarensis TaxID=2755585 RepID=UPI001602EE26|nr:hypothetical protein [Rhodopirellula sp. JC639]
MRDKKQRLVAIYKELKAELSAEPTAKHIQNVFAKRHNQTISDGYICNTIGGFRKRSGIVSGKKKNQKKNAILESIRLLLNELEKLK